MNKSMYESDWFKKVSKESITHFQVKVLMDSGDKFVCCLQLEQDSAYVVDEVPDEYSTEPIEQKVVIVQYREGKEPVLAQGVKSLTCLWSWDEWEESYLQESNPSAVVVDDCLYEVVGERNGDMLIIKDPGPGDYGVVPRKYVSMVLRPKGKLPEEPGIYIDRDGDPWELVEIDGNLRWFRLTNDMPHDICEPPYYSDEFMARFLPLTLVGENDRETMWTEGKLEHDVY